MLTETTTDGATLLFSRTCTRDLLGRITAVTEVDDAANSSTVLYAYDDAGRLVAECSPAAPGQGDVDDPCGEDTTLLAGYTYDANGNRLTREDPQGTEVGTYDDQDRLATYAGAAYTFGPNGELQARLDADGTAWTFEHDTFGNLFQTTRDDGQAALTVDYRLDPRGRRIGRRDPTTGAWRYWPYQDQLEPVAELDDQGQLVTRFLYATRAHTPDALIKDRAGQPVLYLLVGDHVGSIRRAIRASDGAIVQRIDYDAFGRLQLDTNPDFQPFGFAGGLHDRFTGLIRFGARDYDPTTGRWTAKDPIRWAGGQANLYAYVDNDPVNAVDPSGLRVRWRSIVLGQDIRSATWRKIRWRLGETAKQYPKLQPGSHDFFEAAAADETLDWQERYPRPEDWSEGGYQKWLTAAAATCARRYLQARTQFHWQASRDEVKKVVASEFLKWPYLGFKAFQEDWLGAFYFPRATPASAGPATSVDVEFFQLGIRHAQDGLLP
ncbi:MAG: RHS repeat-associated core domain-containing protein [Myxococcales bacterium]|nr:RHS repeat-associated core domain-containing protein [Myxococcales bacterium]